jgi:hypothetical protein
MKKLKARSIDVWVVLPERVLLLDIAGPIEVLRRANVEQQAVQFNVRYAGSGRRVTSSVGIALADIAPFPDRLPAEAMIIVPGAADGIAFAEDADPVSVRHCRLAENERSSRPYSADDLLRRASGGQSGTIGRVFLYDPSHGMRRTRCLGTKRKGLGKPPVRH